jgi:hypothetical protein
MLMLRPKAAEKGSATIVNGERVADTSSASSGFPASA